jgi:hypothetical protein
MSKSFKIRNRASSCSRTSKLNSTMALNPKYSLAKDIAELIELIEISDANKEQVYSIYSPDSSSAANEIQALNVKIAKLKDKIQQQQYENKVRLRKALKNRYKMLVNTSNTNGMIRENADDSEESENQEIMYRVLRKLNQDATYALDQFKEAIMQSEEDIDDEY